MARTATPKKFFSILMNEVGSIDSGQTGLAVSPQNNASPHSFSEIDRGLYQLYESLVQRRNFAILCMTPDKFASASAKDLAVVARELSVMADKVKALLMRSGKGEVEDKVIISDDEKRRIESLLGASLGK